MTAKILIFVFALIYLSFSTCPITHNTKKLISDEPRLIKTSSDGNGQKLLIGSLDDPQKNFLYVANLKGTPKQMGVAFGQLYSQQLKQMMIIFYKYYMQQLEGILQKKLPVFLAKKTTNSIEGLLKRVLDLNVMITKRYTNKRYYEQIQGIAEGAKMPSKELQRLNLFPELVKAACTVAGVWGPATLHHQTLHVRALDWDAKNYINKYPIVVVYHPSDPKLNIHANFAWVGFVGSLTGMSKKITLGQKVWLPPKNSVQMTRYGNPWTYVFRDILYDANNLAEAIEILQTTHRTCAIHIGLGATQDHTFRMLEYSQKVVNIYDDKNYTHYNSSYHPQKAGIAYFDKHVQPSHDDCVGHVLTDPNMYGKWQMQSLWRILGLTHQTGNTQLVVFNLESQQVVLSYSQFGSGADAFRRSPIYMNMEELFKDF